MAANAYVLIAVDPAQTRSVAEKLVAVPGAMVREVLGPYDFDVELEADTEEDLTSALRNNIRHISGVTSTVTCLWF